MDGIISLVVAFWLWRGIERGGLTSGDGEGRVEKGEEAKVRRRGEGAAARQSPKPWVRRKETREMTGGKQRRIRGEKEYIYIYIYIYI